MPATVEVSVLGAVELRRDGRPLDLGAPKQRALVTALALARGWPVSVDAVVDLLWGDDAPPGVTGTLQSYVSQLRRVIEPDRAPRTPATVLVTAAPGYALKVPDEAYDVHRFEQAVLAAHGRLQSLVPWGGTSLPADLLAREVSALDAALESWRGTPYTELGDVEAARAERSRLTELRLVALEDRASARLALGDHATQAAELEALTLTHPLRERLWALRAVALARSGRQADALEVLRRVREVLQEELGIEPSTELRELQTALLRQDERLEWRPPPTREHAPPAAYPPSGAARPDLRPEDQQVAPWPMVGRDAELATLVAAVMEAAAGRPTFAVITGEPGIGKSRLAAEALLQARRRSARLLVGRCSQDEGAPPLWPWQAVLGSLGVDLVRTVTGTQAADEGGPFRAWERICSIVLSAAREQPTVLLLDDLHWADPSTLRVLRLLLESATAESLTVIGTWRSHPAPAGELADVAEAFARRHAAWVELGGLPGRDARAVFESVAHQRTDAPDAALLLARTDGNPFFLVELARLAASRDGDVDLAAGRLPSAVGEVIDRRLARLPAPTVDALRVAAVIGRRFDLPTLAAAARLDEDDALDVVEPAQAAGLLRDQGVDHYVFAHALVRDRLRESLGASRRARVHARVAEALAGTPGHDSEVARHWLAAGPVHARRAWQAAVAAAGLVRRLHDHDEAAKLLSAALASQADDPRATPSDRYAVLMLLVDAHRWAARLPDLVSAAERAIAVARELGDAEALARAAMSASVDVLWRSAPPGEVSRVVVDALEESLLGLPDGDGEVRCRTLLALAMERSGVATPAETAPLVEEGLSMAQRLGDPQVLMSAQQIAFMAQWSPRTAERRLEWISDATDTARRLGCERIGVVTGTLRTAALCELGRVPEMWEQLAATRAEATRLRIAYGDLVLTALETSWFAMAGRREDCEHNLAHLEDLAGRLRHSTVEPLLEAVRVMLAYWAGDTAAVVPTVRSWVQQDVPLQAMVAVYLWRAGEEEAARAYYAEHGAPLEQETNAMTLARAQAAELAACLGDAALAAAAYDALLPSRGRPATAAAALVFAPVDAYLALAAATVGDAAAAKRHADDALVLAGSWRLPVVAGWLGGLRERHGF